MDTPDLWDLFKLLFNDLVHLQSMEIAQTECKRLMQCVAGASSTACIACAILLVNYQDCMQGCVSNLAVGGQPVVLRGVLPSAAEV